MYFQEYLYLLDLYIEVSYIDFAQLHSFFSYNYDMNTNNYDNKKSGCDFAIKHRDYLIGSDS